MGSAPLNLLLDTHIWLWSRLHPDRLSALVREALVDNDNVLWLSPVSVWETLMLARKGRVELKTDPSQWVTTALATHPFREAPLNFAVAQASESLTLRSNDPADRFLAATAVVYELVLVTADRRLVPSREYRTLKN